MFKNLEISLKPISLKAESTVVGISFKIQLVFFFRENVNINACICDLVKFQNSELRGMAICDCE